MLYLIGLGVSRDHITLGALEAVKKCDELYLENYTSIGLSKEELEEVFGKGIELVDRGFVESFDVSKCKEKNIGILIYGDIFSATTHVSLFLDCKKEYIGIKLVNGVSILTLVGNIGLNLYNYGKIISIPFQDVDLIKGLKENGSLHTLFLLDLNLKENKFVSVNEALKRLLKQGMEDRLCVGVERLGFNDERIVVKKAKEMIDIEFSKYPQCLIAVGKLHFVEEEVLNSFK